MGQTTTLILPVGVAYEVEDVVRVVARDYPSIIASHVDGELVLSSSDHSAACLTAIGWAAAAKCALAPMSSRSRAQLMDYLLW